MVVDIFLIVLIGGIVVIVVIVVMVVAIVVVVVVENETKDNISSTEKPAVEPTPEVCRPGRWTACC